MAVQCRGVVKQAQERSTFPKRYQNMERRDAIHHLAEIFSCLTAARVAKPLRGLDDRSVVLRELNGPRNGAFTIDGVPDIGCDGTLKIVDAAAKVLGMTTP